MITTDSSHRLLKRHPASKLDNMMFTSLLVLGSTRNVRAIMPAHRPVDRLTRQLALSNISAHNPKRLNTHVPQQAWYNIPANIPLHLSFQSGKLSSSDGECAGPSARQHPKKIPALGSGQKKTTASLTELDEERPAPKMTVDVASKGWSCPPSSTCLT